MNKLILILNHADREAVTFNKDWHNPICDTKVIWQTDQKSDNQDIIAIDMPGKIVIANVMRILCFYAARYKYDYYCLMAGDCYILKKDFIDKAITYMKKDKADVCFTHIDKRLEHYKCSFYDMIVRNYHIDRDDIRWSLNICNIVSRKAVNIYNEFSFYKIYDEADFPNVFHNKLRTITYPGINYNYFNAANIAEFNNCVGEDRSPHLSGMVRSINNENPPLEIVHAIKNYKLLKEFNVCLT